MNGRRMTIVIGRANAASGSATPSGFSSRSSSRSSRYSGSAAAVSGNSSPRVNRVYSASRPLNV